MELEIVTRHFDIPTKFVDLINKRYERLKHYTKRIMDGRLTIECDGSNYSLEFLLRLRGRNINVHAINPNLLVGTNSLFNKLRRKLKKEEEKVKAHRVKSKS